MNGKLFLTLSAAIVFGGVILFYLLKWLREAEEQTALARIQPKGQIGFAAIMKQRG